MPQLLACVDPAVAAAQPLAKHEPSPREVRDRGEQFCVGTPEECIRFIELYEALGIEEMILLCAVGPAAHEEVLNTLRLFGEQVIPHFRAKEKREVAN